ncbi:hypothetical protein E3W21_15455 [Pseudomonas sp. F01002]|nr:hypothetical protein E3W21_15455 [Pseudomonas sp. F01002]
MWLKPPSRASPLPHWNAVNCGSGLARDDGRPGTAESRLNRIHKAGDFRPFLRPVFLPGKSHFI